MNLQEISAILLITGVAVLLISSVIGPQGIYQTLDLQRRIQIIEESKTRWYIAQSLIGLDLLITSAGFVALALRSRTTRHTGVPGLGAAIFAVGTMAGLFFVYRQSIDPFSTYQGAYTSFG